MGSLHIGSHFTNILLDYTTDILVDQLFENPDTVEGFTKSELKQLLYLGANKPCFIFNGLNECLQGFKSVFYQRLFR